MWKTLHKHSLKFERNRLYGAIGSKRLSVGFLIVTFQIRSSHEDHHFLVKCGQIQISLFSMVEKSSSFRRPDSALVTVNAFCTFRNSVTYITSTAVS